MKTLLIVDVQNDFLPGGSLEVKDGDKINIFGEEIEIIEVLVKEGQSIKKNDSLITLNFSPSDIINTASSSEEVSYSELKNQIQSLKNNGVNTLKWEVDLNYKIAYSFISIIVIFCGIPLSVYRSNTTLAFGGGLSLATIFSYVILLKFGQSLAYGGVLSPFFGAWMSNFVFISIGIYLMLNARK